MFDSLTKKLSSTFARLAGRDKIREGDITEAMRDVKIALLEADVALPAIRDLVARIEAKALGEKIISGVDASAQLVKIAQDELAAMLGGADAPMAESGVILMAGLNGSGKTTSAAKLALHLKKKGRRVMLASTDIYRPQAREQLGILGARIGVDVLPITSGEEPLAIVRRALLAAKNYDALILDTAGRMGVDEALMRELAAIKKLAAPVETLLAIDAMAGQDGLAVARQFSDGVGLSGAIITRIDGDARGGVALSLASIVGVPIKFLGVGERPEDLESFHPERIAGRILGMGDIVSLVEAAQEKIDEKEAARLAEKMFDGAFTFDDMLAQIRQMKKLGSPSGLLKLLPGIGGMAEKLAAAGMNDEAVRAQEAMILSMTPRERRAPDIILLGRKKRIAAGAGVSLSEVEKLLKNYYKSKAAMEKMKSMGGLSGFMEAMKNMGE
ncbi:MAG: signal recognition particle protein [Rickettsiales bacterium]|jgi:signal recognition particle subunit SRP54|nr:signal recognition particle protein [Rickettsiales bacterium]